jgi:LTXXQ motif family protein
MRHFLPPFALLAACTFALAAQLAPGEASEPKGMERMQHWAADHDALLDAKLAGLRAGLELTSDQDKRWPPFETAVRDAAKLHMEQMKSMMDRMQKMGDMMIRSMQKSEDMKDMDAAGQESPIDRLEALGQGMSERGAAITKVADAAKPLYGSLDDSQKRRFVLLGRVLFMMEHDHPGMDMMRGGMDEGGGAMGREGMGDRMERMGHRTDEGEDNPDDE